MKVIPKQVLAQIKQLEDKIKEINVVREAIKIKANTKAQVLVDDPLIKQEIVKRGKKLYLIEKIESHVSLDRGNDYKSKGDNELELKVGDYLVNVGKGYQLNNYEMEEVK